MIYENYTYKHFNMLFEHTHFILTRLNIKFFHSK